MSAPYAESSGSPGSPEQLREAPLELHGRITVASNATFLGTIGDVTVVYKPIAGEKPLWDFPEGKLAHREVAAYVVSEATGWGIVPQTWLRSGPHGLGMVQRWCEPDPDQEAVTIVPAGRVPGGYLHVFDGEDGYGRDISLVHEDTPQLRRMAVFDVIVNNADRKGGHVLEMPDGHRYGIDHGICFHVENKLRTVLWGWAGEPLTTEELEVVRRVRDGLDDEPGGLGEQLWEWLPVVEIEAMAARCDRLLATGTLPLPHSDWHVIPWPPF